jgi:hypothetical protein
MPVYEYQGQHYDLAETDPAAAKAKILAYLAKQQPPSRERTYGEALQDIGAGVVGGIGSLVQLPGQLYGLATGDMRRTGALGVGKDIEEYAESLKSAGLKAREEARRKAIEEATAKEGQFGAFKTAFSETVKDPGLLLTFLAEQAPQLLVPFGAAKIAKGATVARGAGEAAAAQAGVRGAIGAAGVQQGADVGAGAYENIYNELKSKGATDAEAAQGALNLARAAGASGAIISVLAQRLPGAKALEETFAGVPSVAGRAGRVGRGAVGEGVSEVGEEVGGRFSQNLAMREVKPEQSLTEGLGETAGMAAIGGVGLGGVAGLARRPTPQEPAVEIPPTEQPPITSPTQQRVEETTGIARPQGVGIEGLLSAQEAERQRIAMAREKADEAARQQAERTRLEGVTGETQFPLSVPETPRFEPEPPTRTQEELAARQAEIDRRRQEAGLPTAEQQRAGITEVERPKIAASSPVPKLVDPRPLTEQQANARLGVLKDMLQIEGGDPNSLGIVPHPTVQGKFAIKSFDLPFKLSTEQQATAFGTPEKPVVIDPVEAYVNIARQTNTPASQRFVKDWEAGRIPREDVQRALQTERQLLQLPPLTFLGSPPAKISQQPIAGPTLEGVRDVFDRPVTNVARPPAKPYDLPPPVQQLGVTTWVIEPGQVETSSNIELPSLGFLNNQSVDPVEYYVRMLTEMSAVEPTTQEERNQQAKIKAFLEAYNQNKIPRAFIEKALRKQGGTPTTQPPVQQPPTEQPTAEQPQGEEAPISFEEFKLRMPVARQNAEVLAANNQGNIQKLGEALAKSSNPAIAKIGELTKLIVGKVTLKKPTKFPWWKGGEYVYNTDSIQMNKTFAGDEHTNAHELVHGLISKSQRFPGPRQLRYANDIKTLFEHVKKELAKKGMGIGPKYKVQVYGLTNEREFTAEAMTNPEFQYMLMQIPYKGKKSAWSQFVQVVANLLGIKDTNALTEVMSLVEKLAEIGRPRTMKRDASLVDEEGLIGNISYQKARTNQPAFKRWFKNSKVVDKDGNPLIMYHGTKKSNQGQAFTYFDVYNANYGLFGYGGYFTDDANVASEYTGKGKGETPTVYPVYLSIQNPLDMDAVADKNQWTSLNESLEDYHEGGNTNESWYRALENYYKDNNYSREEGASAIQEDLINMGYDGITHIGGGRVNREGVNHRVYIAFDPEQIKSIFNKGAWSESKKEIDESRIQEPSAVQRIKQTAQQAMQKREPLRLAPQISEQTAQQLQATFAPENKTIIDKIEGLKDRFWQRIAQGMADQFRSIREYDEKAYMQARLSKSIDGGLEGLLFYGEVFNDDGALNIRRDGKGLIKALEPVGTEVDNFMIWIALNREANLRAAGRNPSIPDDLLAQKDTLSSGTLNGQPRLQVYQRVLQDMNKLNRSVLKIALDTGLIDQQGFENFSNDIYYVPFYKEMEGKDIDAPSTASGLTSQYFSKQLKGGERPFGDLVENTLRNWNHILSAAMKNQAAVSTLQAAQNVVLGDTPVVEPTNEKTGSAKVMVDGQAQYFKVNDPLLLDAISAIGYLGPKSKFLDVARGFKNILQFGVTLSPAFKVNNLIRDSVSAMAVTELKKNPIANVLNGISVFNKDDPTYMSALAGGAIFNFGTAYEGDQSKLIKRLIEKGIDRDTILDTDSRIKKGLRTAWDKYQEWGNASESANRLALYQQLRDQGMSHLEAAYKARDLLDFSMQGSWPAFRLVTQVVPFMNARIQGLYKLGRDGVIPTTRVLYNTATGQEIEGSDKQKAQAFGIVTSAVMLASMALYLTFKDDEEYKKRDEWDRDNFWWFKLPGMQVALRVPKPFEIGAFGTLTERVLEQALDQGAEGKQFGDALKRMLGDTFALNPTPQMFKPLLDLYANKDSFTGAPIETAGLERLSKQERALDTTSELAKALGGLSSILPEKFELSPVQVDYAVKGYFGWLGGAISVISNYAVMPFKEGSYPDAKWIDRASLGLARDLPANQAKYVTSFYENAKEINQAFADMRHYAEIGDSQKVEQIIAEKGDKIQLAKFYDKTSKNMSEIRQQIRVITADPTMSGSDKREEIDRMKLLISDLAKQAEEVRKSLK